MFRESCCDFVLDHLVLRFFYSSSGYNTPFSSHALPAPVDFLFHVPADCDQICTNTPGSYSCSCVSGYQPSSDGKSCVGESLDKP